MLQIMLVVNTCVVVEVVLPIECNSIILTRQVFTHVHIRLVIFLPMVSARQTPTIGELEYVPALWLDSFPLSTLDDREPISIKDIKQVDESDHAQSQR